VILDLERFQIQAKPRWNILESLLALLEGRPDHRLNPTEAEQLQELYTQTAADLNRVTHGALAPELRQYLERLVARAYAELYYVPPTRSSLWQWRRWLGIFTAFPETFRRQSRYFALAVLITTWAVPWVDSRYGTILPLWTCSFLPITCAIPANGCTRKRKVSGGT